MSRGWRADHSPMSAPTQKARSPAPVRITHRISWSSSTSSTASSSAAIIAGVSALSFCGRSSVMVARASRRESLTAASERATSSAGEAGVALRMAASEHETEGLRPEQGRVHGARTTPDDQREFHLVENVRLEIDARGDLGDLDSVRREPHDAALRHVGDVLALRDGTAARERDVLDRIDEFSDPTFLFDPQAPVLHGELAAGHEEPREHDLARPRRDVDESAGARGHMGPHAELRDVDRALSVDLEERQERGVEARALVDYPGDRAVPALLDQDPRHVRGDAEAEVHRIAVAQLLGHSPCDYLGSAPLGEPEAR